MTEYTEAMAALPTGVTVVTVRDGRDDIGGTVSALCSISADPPVVMLSLSAEGYLREVVDRQGAFAVSVLGAGHRALAGRFSAEGRPSARLLLDAEPHARGEATGALVLTEALAALECTVERSLEVGDHAVYFAAVAALPRVEGGRGGAGPLVRYGGGYRTLG
ncbi:flavin reductase family protein [Nocardiopsis baichengensis]|uniref:flavin reductase family protein n=1 Tax=Nocardiopsis baichengensis TaxID=280240 RepID=UPI00034D8BC2|nr:flavin reductase family protein [Nocardiopsis baichengensis]